MIRFSTQFTVPGKPVAQPRPRLSFRGGHARAFVPKSHPVWPWRKAIEETAEIHKPDSPLQKHVALALVLTFFFPRPKSHFTKKGKLAKGAPVVYHVQKPDLDNLIKPIKDVLENVGFYANDSQVCQVSAHKYWAPGGVVVPEAGVRVAIYEI